MEGRQLLGLKITAGVRGERPLLRPQVKFSASLHGDEAVSRELLIGLARSAAGGLSVDNNREYEIALIISWLWLCRALCEQHEFDPEITALLGKCEVHLLPSLNPDGAVHRTRTNANNKVAV